MQPLAACGTWPRNRHLSSMRAARSAPYSTGHSRALTCTHVHAQFRVARAPVAEAATLDPVPSKGTPNAPKLGWPAARDHVNLVPTSISSMLCVQRYLCPVDSLRTYSHPLTRKPRSNSKTLKHGSSYMLFSVCYSVDYHAAMWGLHAYGVLALLGAGIWNRDACDCWQSPRPPLTTSSLQRTHLLPFLTRIYLGLPSQPRTYCG